MNMVNMNNSGTLVGPPCEMVGGGKVRPCLQYGWSRWLVNMPIHTRFDFHGGIQIKATKGNGPKNDREGGSLGCHFFTQELFAQ